MRVIYIQDNDIQLDRDQNQNIGLVSHTEHAPSWSIEFTVAHAAAATVCAPSTPTVSSTCSVPRLARHVSGPVRLFTRWLRMRRANHSEAVWPVLNLSVVSPDLAATAEAMTGDSAVSARRGTSLPGRVKKTRDQRVKAD